MLLFGGLLMIGSTTVYTVYSDVQQRIEED